jgi:hypothetical protein
MKIPEKPSKQDIGYINSCKPRRRNPFDEPVEVVSSTSKSKGSEKTLRASGGGKPPVHPKSKGMPTSPDGGNFPLEVLPEIIRNMVTRVAASSGLHISLHALAALAVLSAAYGKRFMTQVSDQRYPTPCNLMVLLSAATSIGKSILRAYAEAFMACDKQRRDQYCRNLSKMTLEHDLFRKSYEKAKEKIIAAKQSGGDIKLLQAEAEALVDQVRHSARQLEGYSGLCLNRTTGAGLRNHLARGDQAVFLLSLDGAGHLLNAFNSKDALLAELLLAGVMHEPTGSHTGHSGSYNGEPLLSGLFTIQPHKLHRLLSNEEAAESGLLNRFTAVDSTFLDAEKASCGDVSDPDAERAWADCINAILDVRFNGEKDLIVNWVSEAEEIYNAFDREVDEVLKLWPDNIRNHVGRTREMAIRMGGILHGVQFLAIGKSSKDVATQVESAKGGVALARWIFCHRLKIQEKAFLRHIANQADLLEKKLSQKDGELPESAIKDSYKKLYPDLEQVLSIFPERFGEKSKRVKGTGPVPRIIYLRKAAS